MSIQQNHIIGLLCIIAGITIVVVALGNLLVRVVVALAALSLINYGLHLRGFPPLQLLLPMMARKNRWM